MTLPFKKIVASLSLITVLSLSLFSAASVALADPIGPSPASSYTLLEPLPCIPGNGVTCAAGQNITSPDFKTYIQYAFNLAIAVAAVAAVVMIVWGGFQYMTTDSIQDKSDGLEKVRHAIEGLLLVLCSYLILRTIDPRLVAIPSTLVPQIQLSTPISNASQNILNQLQSQSDQIQAQTQSEIAAREADKVAVTSLQQKLDALNTELAAAHDDPTVTDAEYNALKAQQQDLTNQINNTVSDEEYNRYVAAIDGSLNGLIQSKDPSGTVTDLSNSLGTIRTAEDLADKAYTDGLSNLIGTGNDKEREQLLGDEYNLIRGQLAILEYLKGATNADTAAKIEGQIQSNIANIHNPQKQAQLSAMYLADIKIKK